MTDLGAAFDPIGINPAGQLLGSIVLPEVQERHAVLWANGVLTDLGTLGGSFSQAFGINPSGQVVGFSVTAANETHATLWTRK
jgi:probable HAF family extracellular repeat protein